VVKNLEFAWDGLLTRVEMTLDFGLIGLRRDFEKFAETEIWRFDTHKIQLVTYFCNCNNFIQYCHTVGMLYSLHIISV